MVIDDGSGGGTSASAAAARADGERGRYSGAFRAVDETTGQPVAGLPYRIELPRRPHRARRDQRDRPHPACQQQQSRHRQALLGNGGQR